MNQMITYHSLKHYSITLIGVFILLLGNCTTAYSQNQTGDMITQAHEDIIGTWLSAEGENTKWVVTDSQIKTYYKGQLNDTFTYNISREPNHCGYDVSDRLEKYPSESILVLTRAFTVCWSDFQLKQTTNGSQIAVDLTYDD